MPSSFALPVLALRLVPQVGDRLIKTLISYAGSPEAVFTLSKAQLAKIPGVPASVIDEVTKPAYREQAGEHLLWAERYQVQVYTYLDKEYPQRLLPLHDAPALLFYQGNADLNHSKMIGIVGTRKSTDYGQAIVKEMMQELRLHQPVIVSGLAYGIDIAAHKAALNEGLATIGVMATGPDSVYPSAHRSAAKKMLEQGGLLTENLPGTPSDPRRFPARNRIIAGLSDTLIVVEAAAKGGALITAELAHAYDREVFAVPGALNQPYSEGCNNLIRSLKASIYTGVKDLEYILDWERRASAKQYQPQLKAADFKTDEWELITIMRKYQQGVQIDELSWQVQKSVNQVASLLLNLEFKGTVSAKPGKKFVLNH